MDLYDIKVKRVNQEYVSLDKYRGKILLIVNSATKCGFTKQYQGLEELYRKYKDKGFEILDFPCNQFFKQAPGTDLELASFCKLNYQTSFETFAKIDVNGKNQAELYQYLKSANRSSYKLDLKEQKQKVRIKWNFTKFLVDRSGNVIGRYASSVTPSEIDSELSRLFD